MATKKKPATAAQPNKPAKPTTTAQPSKPTKPTKAAKRAKAPKKKPAAKGKRYTPAKKKKVISFVESVNAKKGRGGVTAAVKKFGITALTISNWIKKEGGGAVKAAKAAVGPRKRAGKRPGKTAGTWERMVALKAEIDGMEKELAAKKAEFSQLAKKL